MMNLSDILNFYRRQGAPADQAALISLLTEVQRENGGAIPKILLTEIADYYGVKEALFLAIIRRVPRLRLTDTHTLEICAGPNCGKSAALAAAAEGLCKGKNISLKFVPCMRLCGKGPNLRWDGAVYNHADVALLEKLIGRI